MTEKLRVVIVGAGLMGRWHAHYARRAGAIVTAIVDSDLEAARRFAGRRRVHVFSSLEHCLERTRADIAHVCTPSGTHAELVRMALEADTHVLVEKPAAPTLQVTESLVQAAELRGKLLNPVHQFPFQRGFQRLLARRLGLGDAVYVQYEAFTAGAEGLSRDDRRRILFEILPHPFSLAVRLFGADCLDAVACSDRGAGGDIELCGMIRGARFRVSISHRGRPTRNMLTYVGTRGTARIDLYHGFGVFEDGSTTSRRTKALRPLDSGARLLTVSSLNLARRLAHSVWAYPGLPDLLGLFYAAVRSGQPPPVTTGEILATARAMDRLRPST